MSEIQELRQEMNQQFTQVNKAIDTLQQDVGTLKQDNIKNTSDHQEMIHSIKKLGLEFESLRHEIRDVLDGHLQNDTRIRKLETTVETHTEDIAILKLVARAQGKN